MIVRVVAASLLTLLCARTAYAQPQSLPDAERSSLLQQANEARTQGQWARVAELLQRALAIRPSVSVRAGLAGAYQELGRYQETAEQSTLCLQGAATDRDLREEQRTTLVDSCAAFLRNASTHLANVTLEVSPDNVEGATLRVDGEPLDGFAPGRPFFLTPGRRRFQLQAPNRAEHESLQLLRAGTTETVRVTLAPRLAVATPPAPTTATQPPAAPLPERPVLLPPPTAPSASPVPWIVGGVGLAALGVGVGYLVWAQSASDDARALCPDGCATEDESRRVAVLNQQHSDRVGVGVALTVAGGVGVAVSTVWLLVRGSPSARSARVLPTGNGLVIRF